MTSQDAKAFMAALIGPGDRRNVRDAAATARLIMSMICDTAWDRSGKTIKFDDDTFRFGLPKRHTFGDMLAAIIDASTSTWDGTPPDRLLVSGHARATHPLLVSWLEVSVHRPFPHADIKLHSGDLSYTFPYFLRQFALEQNNISKDKEFEKYVELDPGGSKTPYFVTRTVTTTLFCAIGDCLRSGDEAPDETGTSPE
jgi:hypothetical protein